MTSKNYECLLIAGEKSGEDHALSFVPELKRVMPELNLFGVGGDSLNDLGMELLYHLNDFSSFGFSEVIAQIPFYIKAYNNIVNEVKRRKCKVAILIDFQTFNLKLAKRLKKEGVEVLYYVAPQAWAWKAYRAKILEKTVHTLFTIIPFEKKWFEDRGVTRVKSIPHPLLHHYSEKIEQAKLSLEDKPFRRFQDEIKILLLPGSRKFEVNLMLPKYMEVIRELRKTRNIKASVVMSPSIPKEFFSKYLDECDKVYSNLELDDALTEADFSLATSGTVTLACALFEVPSIVCYRSSFLNEFIYDYIIRYEGFVSLANIIHEKMVFPEVLKEQCHKDNILKAIMTWIENEKCYNEIKDELSKTKKLVGGDLEDVPSYMGNAIKHIYEVN